MTTDTVATAAAAETTDSSTRNRVALLAIVPTLVIPGNGLTGLITQVPVSAAAVGLGYYAWHRVSRPVNRKMWRF